MSAISDTKIRPATENKDYGYGNARVRGMRSRLLDAPFMDQLIECQDIGQMIQALSSTPYASELEEVLIQGRTAAMIDEALKNNMVRTYRKVLGFLNAEARELVVTLLGRWDLFNVKTVIRGAHLHIGVEEVRESLLPAGELSIVELDALAKLGEVKAVVDTLATWGVPYAPALRKGYMEFMRSGELSRLELEIDTYFAGWASKRLVKKGENSELARNVLAVQVDITNLVTMFRLQKADIENVDVTAYFLPGGADVRYDLFLELAQMSDIDEVLDRLRSTRYGKALEDVAVAYLESNSIAVFERALEDYLVRKALAAGVGDPLGVGVIIAYLWAKQNEITNLRIIVKGKSVGMPVDRVRSELILV